MREKGKNSEFFSLLAGLSRQEKNERKERERFRENTGLFDEKVNWFFFSSRP